MHFSFNKDIYIRIDGVAMGSLLDPVIVNISMVELERVLVPKLNDHVKKKRPFVDDTFVYVKLVTRLNRLNMFCAY